MNRAAARTAIARGLHFLQSCQMPNGCFPSQSSLTERPFQPLTNDTTTFTPMLMLSALMSVPGAEAQTIRDGLASWLLNQKSPQWSYNWWDRAWLARAGEALSYPDDLDDTFCALIGLYQHQPSLIDGEALGTVVRLLLATETKVGGPYRTWLASQHAGVDWKDVDLAVNTNISGFLKLVAEPLPNLTALMEQAITSSTYYSHYYLSPYPVIYYLVRAYDGPLRPNMAQYLAKKQQDDWWESPHYTAFAVSALAQLGEAKTCDAAIKKLLAAQQADGSWQGEAHWVNPGLKGNPYFGGATALTTAMALEALARCLAAQADAPRPKTQPAQHAAARLQASIAAAAQKEMERFGPALKQPAMHALSRTFGKDESREITLLAHVCNESLLAPIPASQTDLLLHLGLANLYGWLAYTIYDDFLDNEGNPELLSVANAAQRASLQHFGLALPGDDAFQKLVPQTFDAIDEANAWELAHCRMTVNDKTITLGRLPRFTDTTSLADRSLGHTLPVMGVLAAAGISPADPRAMSVQLALRHYLAARQLNDDLHDWEQDLGAGSITYVTARILRSLAIKSGTYQFTQLLPKMRHDFWHQTLPEVCAVILNHTALARQAAADSTLLKELNFITDLADKIDGIVHHTLEEQTKAETFLAAYSGTKTATPKGRTRSSPKSRSTPRRSTRRPT